MTQISSETKSAVRDLLMELIRIPSVRGHEGPAARHLCDRLQPLTDRCELIAIDDAIIQDVDYAFPLPEHTYRDTPNLECVLAGNGRGRSIVFNTHLDIVPPSEGQTHAFDPIEENGTIFGRGACDAKGQVATLYALILLLRERGVRPLGDLRFHFVVEEENGGNGTLAMIRRGARADAAVVLEPSEMTVIPAVRGAVWFDLKVFGRAAHSGNVAGRISALDKAVVAMQALRDYHDRLLANSRGLPLFDEYADPMPLTFGMLSAGTWPASVPSVAELKGVLGFLPNHHRHGVQEEMRQTLRLHSDEWLRDHFELTFPMLNSDGNMIPVDHPLVTSLRAAICRNQVPDRVRAMTASCDAWLYNNQAQIPTVVFGPGSLSHAHSKEEQIKLDDILTAASVLADWVMDAAV